MAIPILSDQIREIHAAHAFPSFSWIHLGKIIGPNFPLPEPMEWLKTSWKLGGGRIRSDLTLESGPANLPPKTNERKIERRI
jgi:trehalose utilization protein